MVDDAHIVLYEHWRSSSSYRVRIALNVGRISYRSCPIDLYSGEHLHEGYLKIHPQGLVPALDIDGLRLWQSLAIIEYLNETRHLGLLPTQPAQRALVRALVMVIAADIQPVCSQRIASRAAEHSGGAIAPDVWMRDLMTPVLIAADRMLAESPAGRFCCGDAVTMADIVLMPQLYNAKALGIDDRNFPRLAAVGTALSDLPAFAAAHPEKVRLR